MTDVKTIRVLEEKCLRFRREVIEVLHEKPVQSFLPKSTISTADLAVPLRKFLQKTAAM